MARGKDCVRAERGILMTFPQNGRDAYDLLRSVVPVGMSVCDTTD